LKGAGIPWREDRSNGDVTIARNALRADFIPNLSEMLGRDVQAGAARTRRLLEADAMALSEAARAALPAAYAGAEVLNRADFKGLPEALGRRALRTWLQKRQVYGSLSAAGFDQLLGAVLGEEEKGCRSAGEEFVVFDEARIWCEGSIKDLAGPAACSLKMNLEERLSTGAVLYGEWVEVDPALMARLADGKVDPFTECFAALPEGTEELQVRGLVAGDRYRALGAPGSRKLKDCLMDRGLSERERKLLPVVCLKEHEIIWVPGLPVLDAYRLRPESKRALRLTYGQGEAL
jgi:tRNA(Ile)-lysidine synthase